eukprot:s7401_g3.t1
MALPPGPLEAKPKVQVVPKQPEAVPKLAVPEQTTAAVPKHPPVEVAEAPKPKVKAAKEEKEWYQGVSEAPSGAAGSASSAEVKQEETTEEACSLR